MSFRTSPVVVHVFVLTLGFSRRRFYDACADERLAQFLEAHEWAFAHFGVLSEEVASKAEKNITMRTCLARFPFVKRLEAFDFAS